MPIRKAIARDADAISDLTLRVSAKFIAHEFSEEGKRTLFAALSPEEVRRNMDGDCCYHVFEEAGDVIGVVAMRSNGHLLKLFVAEAMQGRGIARDLWDTARLALLAAGFTGQFTVSSSRGAVGVYEKFGFVRDGEETVEHGIARLPMRMDAREGVPHAPQV